MLKRSLLLLTAVSTVHPFAHNSFLTYRSQGVNLARTVSGWDKAPENHYASVAVEYTRSFDNCAISNYFFGGNELVFSGSRLPNRGNCEVLADYFGLPTDFKSVVRFSPRIQNIIADFDFYWHLSENLTGFSLYLDIPVAHSKWELNPCETVITPGVLAYPAGYMSNERIEHDELQKGALEVLSRCAIFGDLILPLQYGRLVNKQEITKFADILVALGYTSINRDSGYLNTDVHVVVPTGTRSRAITLFEPQVGNGYHWALGVGLHGAYTFANGENNDWNLSASVDARVQHLFKTTQKRSYDLTRNGPGSRYMLLEDMVKGISNTFSFSPIFGQNLFDKQYITRLVYAIDATTLDSTIKIDVQADIVAKIAAQYHNWHFDLGYNFWARSREKLVCRDQLKHKFYGIKGDAQLYGFFNLTVVQIPLPLNGTQSQATLYAPQGNGNTTDNFVNNNVDNAALAYNAGMVIEQTTVDSLTGTGVTSLAQVNGSNQPIVLTDCDIDSSSGLSPRALSNKLFGSVGYTVDRWERATVHLSLGAEGEFAMRTGCIKTAISQWGTWFKGGVTY